MSLENPTFVINSDGDCHAIDANGIYHWLRHNKYGANQVEREVTEAKKILNEANTALLEKWLKTYDALPLFWFETGQRLWAARNEDEACVWLSVEWFASTDETKKMVQKFTETVGGYFWVLCEDPFEEELGCIQYCVDINVIDLTPIELMKKIIEVCELIGKYNNTPNLSL